MNYFLVGFAVAAVIFTIAGVIWLVFFLVDEFPALAPVALFIALALFIAGVAWLGDRPDHNSKPNIVYLQPGCSYVDGHVKCEPSR